jgi:diguanylate cyclase (GGDEF)-like protein
MITIFFGLFVFVVSVNSKMYSHKLMLLVIGAAYIYIGTLDFMHAVSYDGLNIVFNNTNMSNQFWMSARLLESTVFLTAFTVFRTKEKINYNILHTTLLTYTIGCILLISYNLLPAFYIPNQGQTPIKIMIDFFIILIYFITIFSLMRCKDISRVFKMTLYIVLIIKILSELAFTQYTQVIGLSTIIGHLLKYLSFGGLYIIFVSEILVAPKQQIYSLFQKKEDELLKLSNKAQELIDSMTENKDELFLAMLDIDDFKIINDTYGHLFGDEILVRFAKVISSIRCDQKIVGRYGGDEFLVCGITKDVESRNRCFKMVSDEMKREFSDIEMPITFSVGLVFHKKDDTLKDMIYKADIKLYKSKKNGKNQITF